MGDGWPGVLMTGALASSSPIWTALDPSLDVALNKARPWRETARRGEIYAQTRVADPRSDERREF